MNLGSVYSTFRYQFGGRILRKLVRLLPTAEVFMFHHIGDPDPGGPHKYSITENEFAHLVEAIDRRRNIVGIGDLAAWLSGSGSLPEYPALLTFDDGYRSFLTRAVPILEEYEAQATIYITTGLVERQVPPFEFRLFEALLSSEQLQLSTDIIDIHDTITNWEDRLSKYEVLRSRAKPLKRADREMLLKKIGASSCNVQMLDRTAIEDLRDHPLVTLGAHTHTHRPLGQIPVEDVVSEVERSRQYLFDIGCEPTHFAYPYGSWTPKVRNIVKQHGFQSAVTTIPRPTVKQDDSHTIPRLNWDRSHLRG